MSSPATLSTASLSLERLWESVRRGRPDECWDWTGKRGRRGRGRLVMTGRAGKKIYLNAARVIWGLVHGEESIKGKTLHHECENPPCCNTRHLTPLPQGEHERLHDEDS
ncbi:hypothetical protein LCGC14_2046380 [marine sediment metagenome]|uniref:HNH nuclease domain-containing protein n=1 Tax=marine sediment metagenome TaxID=412755 RepID=A0A0F9HMC4_9ZZZZ